MFTGIIEEIGKIQLITTNKICVLCEKILSDVKLGDSIAVNGVCLTVVDFDKFSFSADISMETIRCTAFESLKTGDCVNLERAMLANGRFGGHIVSGHIDGVGKIVNISKIGEFYNLDIELGDNEVKYVISKGSISVNGISLTVAKVNNNLVKCAIIPKTYEGTSLQFCKVGDFANIEVDIFAKYIEKLLSTGNNRSNIDEKFLIENGFC